MAAGSAETLTPMPSARTLDMKFMFTKLVVADIEKSAAFYTTVFGLVEMHRLEARMMDRAVTEVVYMATHSDGPMFILAQFHDALQPARNELILGFSTDDMASTLARVVAAGGRIVEPAKESYPGMVNAFIADIEGHVVQISQLTG